MAHVIRLAPGVLFALSCVAPASDRTSEIRQMAYDHASTASANDPTVLQDTMVEVGGPRAPQAATTTCVVARVVDGDTIICAPNERVRLIGMDTPELRDAPAGPAAREILVTRLPTGTAVLLEGDVAPRDRYQRTLAYVWQDSLLVNWWLVRNGWARTLTVPPNVRYVDQLVEAQQAARAEHRSLWKNGIFTCSPAAQGDHGC